MGNKSDCGVELLVGCALGAEDSFVKIPLRSAEVNLPIPDGVQDFYYNNTGDYMCGYISALWADIILTQASEKLYSWSCNNLEKESFLRNISEKIYNKTDLFSYIGGIAASTVVILEETLGISSGHPDLMDIPMGVAGALTYIGTRGAMRKFRSKREMEYSKLLAEEELVFDR